MDNFIRKIRNHSEETGQFEGDTCRRNGCSGVIKITEVENCSCHINPPCGACTAPREYCPECDWHAVDDEVHFNGFLVRPANPKAAWSSYRLRPLNTEKIDWHSKAHTHFSMIKEGVFPFGTSINEVRAHVEGTFGGRFEYFNAGRDGKPGKFKYIAYTD